MNVLLMQQVKEIAAPEGCVEISDWYERWQFVQDSFAITDKSQRELELDGVRAEMAKPMIHGDKVLMTIMSMSIVYGAHREGAKLVGFFDDGSNCSIIRKALAEDLGLWGEHVTLELGTINASSTVKTKLYCVELLDNVGGRHLIRAFGLDVLSGTLPVVSLKMIKGDFSAEVQLNWDKLVRPSGQQIDLLIGSEVAHLHPVQKETVSRMVVKTSIFGSGWVLNGAHEMLECGNIELDRNIQIIRSGCYQSNKVVVKYSQEVSFSNVEEYTYEKTEKEFMDGEDLGCEPPRRCIKCKGCQECRFRGAYMSPKQAKELEMMEDRIKFDPQIGKWRVQYPFLQDPSVLRNNYQRVLKMQENTERKIAKASLVDATNEVFDKMISNGALKEIGHAELQLWDGPVHYLPIQVVIHPSSVTTPYRLVTNSSLEDPETGLSLNGILAKGPMALNDTWDISVRFRHVECGLSADISKAYYQMKTGACEKHLRRVLWRHGDVGTPWKIYGFEVVSMGDCCAACFMELTKRGTCKMFGEIDPVAAKKTADDSFVDDVSTGGTKAECERFKGTMDPETCLCDGTIPQILAAGGFQVKAVAVSGEPDGLALEKLGGAVLGLKFSTSEDMLRVTFKVNISAFKHGKTTGPDLTVETLEELKTADFTKRICLRVTSSQYDQLGMVTPITIHFRVLMRDLYIQGFDWDQPLVGELRETWVKMCEMLVRAGGISFRRSTKPHGAVGKCILLCYFDGSDCAFAVVIYARWEMEDGSVFVTLLASKAKVGPMFGTSTPRMEMNGATLVSRVAFRVVMALLEDPPGQIFFLGDSETVLASRERESGFFSEYYGNRIGEQFDNQENIEKIVKVGQAGEWYHVASADNAADRATRLGAVPADLGLDSEWLCGKPYIKLPVNMWPIERNFAEKKSRVKLPVEEVKRKFRSRLDTDGELLIGAVTVVPGIAVGGPGCGENYVLLHYQHGRITNSWTKLVRSTSYLYFWKAKLMTNEGMSVEHMAMAMAVTFWVRVAMPATNKAAMDGKLKHLTPFKHAEFPDILVVTGRAATGFQQFFQKEFLPILMAGTRTAYMIMLWAHDEDHGGVDVTFHTSLQVAWIVGGRVLARNIKRSCVRCRYLSKQLAGQQMGELPAQLMVPCPCFSYVAVDLAGPFLCKKQGSAQTTRKNCGTMKVWAVLIVCLQTKAVKIYLAGGLSTEDFLLVWDEFVADHGQPLVANSDRGSNLVAASKEGREWELPNYDWDKVERTTRGKTEWHFHPPQSQFRNGAVESMVKKFKRTLLHKFASKRMFLLEMQSAFKVIASILNSRPLYARWGSRGGNDPDYLSPLTPNMMMTGRSNVEIPVREYSTSDKPLYRMQYVEECINQWWQQFQTQNFSSLVPRQKWFHQQRNMMLGDVVLVQYEGKSKPGDYRLGVIVDIEEDSGGVVRTVTVEYSILSELPTRERLEYKGISKKRIRVPVQRLVLILPVEERVNDEVTSQRDKNFLPGGQAGIAAEEEVNKAACEVKDVSELYDVVWDTVNKKYISAQDCAKLGEEFHEGQRACQDDENSEDSDHVEEGLGGDVAEGVAVDSDQGVEVTSDDGVHLKKVKDSEEGEEVSDVIQIKFENNFVKNWKSCAILNNKVEFEDYEGVIYSEFCKKFDWSQVEVEDSLEEI